MPTLIFWGEGDRLLPLKHGERLGRALPDSRLVVLEDASPATSTSPSTSIASCCTSCAA